MKKKIWYSVGAFIALTLLAIACGILTIHQYKQEEYLLSLALGSGGLAIKILIPFVLGMILGQPILKLLRLIAIQIKRILKWIWIKIRLYI